jgi:hypothetical protein
VTHAQPYRPQIGNSLTPPLIPLSPSDQRVCSNAQRAILHAFMEKGEADPVGAREVLEVCGLAVRYVPDDDLRPEADTAPVPDWGNFDGPFLRGGKQKHGRGTSE